MKRVLIILIVFSLIENSMAQIKIAKFPEKEKKEVIFTYDSLTNIEYNRNVDILDRLKHLVGQKITSISSSNVYHSMKVYVNGQELILRSSVAEELDGNTFIIDSINGHQFYVTSEDNASRHLEIVITDDVYHIDYAWVCHGYFEKIKNLFLGKELVYIHNDQDYDLDEAHTRYRFMDYKTKRNLVEKIPCNSIWKCTDVLVIDKVDKVLWGFPDYENRVILNVENDKYGKYYIFASELIEREMDEKADEYFMSMENFHKYQAVQNQLRAAAKAKAAKAAEEAQKRAKEHREYIIARYGENKGSLILQGKVVIGMAKEECIEALGTPNRINRTTTASTIYEQWIYSNKYLYFENGKLVTIQD